MNRCAVLAFVVVLALFVAAFARVAAADQPSKQQCVAANESAQALRRAGKLLDARTELLQCVSTACPGPVRDDCSERLNEVEKALPTIVVVAKDAASADVITVRVTNNGAPLADTLSGTAVAVDPGNHVLVFEAEGYVRTTTNVLIREGEKDRTISVFLQPVAAVEPTVTTIPTAAPTPTQEVTPPVKKERLPPVAPAPSPSAEAANVRRTWGYILGASGVVFVGVGGVLLDLEGQQENLIRNGGLAHSLEITDALSSAQADRGWGVTCLSVGGALAIVGVVLWISGLGDHEGDRAQAGLRSSSAPTILPGW